MAHEFFTFRWKPFALNINEWGEPMWLPTIGINYAYGCIHWYFRPFGRFRIAYSKKRRPQGGG